MTLNKLLLVVCISLAAYIAADHGWLPSGTNTPTTATPTPSEPAADRITYVYSPEQPIPPDVRAALRDVGLTGIAAETLDHTATAIAPRDQPAKDAADKSTVPCLVVQSGDQVLKVITTPTAAQIKAFAK